MASWFRVPTPRAFLALLGAALLSLGLTAPASAGVTISFWSHEFGNEFPHAFFVLEGTPDAGGEPVQLSYGFTAKAITPAILMGTVPGRIDETKQKYIENSDVHFSVMLTDAQYAAVLALVEEWGEKGDHRYSLNRRNCVHFVAEAARRAGLTVVENPKLMKKPRSFVHSLEPMNQGRVRLLEMEGEAFYALADRANAPTSVAPAVPQVATPDTAVPATQTVATGGN
ncbi:MULTISPECIES: hypothetical protein [Sphingomonas]|uniref:hypothetical protein n=1 Tax=Sphingomonas TaxID=13687 RepID=UPI0019D0FAFB|nr:hypothetical protein [Sphingomonas sp. ABOLF]GLK19572.1 hypothetical protein GCM10017606_03980 [Microbacterium terregens]